MNKILKISEAAAIAIHACAILGAEKGRRVDARTCQEFSMFSYDHLSKVLQRLTKAGIVRSVKGPSGGFELKRDSSTLYLKDIYEVIEGSMMLEQVPFWQGDMLR